MPRTPRRMLWGASIASIVSTICGTTGLEARAQAPASPTPTASRPASSPAAPAPGTWTISVVSSSADPTAKSLMQGLRSSPWVVANADRVRLSEVNSDASGRSAAGGSTAVLVYQQGPRGVEMMGGRSGFAGAEDVIQWVRTVIAGSAEGSIRDPNLTQANLFGKGLPAASAQSEMPSMPTAQAPYAPAMTSAPGYAPAMMPGPQTTTTYAVPMTTATASVVQAPTQHMIVQQAPVQVLFAPQAPPVVYVPQAGAAAASVPAPNIFMPASTPAPAATANVAPPMMAMTASAPAPMTMATPVAAVGVPTGPMVAGAALTTSSVSVPASHTTSRVRVRGPGPFASALSRLGEKMTTLGRTRIESVQETRLETQTAQSPPGQYMTLSSTSASPVMSPAQTGAPVQSPAPQQCPAPPPQYPQPTPQGGNYRSH